VFYLYYFWQRDILILVIIIQIVDGHIPNQINKASVLVWNFMIKDRVFSIFLNNETVRFKNNDWISVSITIPKQVYYLKVI